MLDDLEIARPHIGPRAVATADGHLRRDAHDTCEPPQRNVLVIEEGIASTGWIDTALSEMSRFEPCITTAGTLEVGRMALAFGGIDLVILIVGDDNASKALEIAAGAPAAVLVMPAPSRRIQRQARHQRTACIALADISPRNLQLLLGVEKSVFVDRTKTVA